MRPPRPHKQNEPSHPAVHVLTGFLGSGKTTLLNRVLRRSHLTPTAVLINEIGAIGVDHLIIETIDEEIVLLESGCVCCSVREEFTASLADLYRRRLAGELPGFEQVILETTGIADPAAIFQGMMADDGICASFRMGMTVTVADAVYALEQLGTHPEVGCQLAFADRIVLSKTDLARAQSLETTRAAVREINPMAALLDSREVDPTRLFDPAADEVGTDIRRRLHERARPEQTTAAPHDPGLYHTFRLSWQEPAPWSEIEAWLSGLLYARGRDILRLKGVLHVSGEGRPILVQGVRQSLYAPVALRRWPGGAPRTDLVFVTRHFTRSAAIRSLRPFIAVEVDAAA
jgi:G3E family GTPase